MDKTVYSGTLLICVVLVIGSGWFPDNAAMWLASTSLVMNIARGILCVLMLGLVLTDPPRWRTFRVMLGAAALGFLSAALVRIYSGSIQIVDALIFLAASVAFGLAAAESETDVQMAEADTLAEKSYFSQNHFFAPPARRLILDMPITVTSRQRQKPTDLFGKAMITVGVLSGALYHNIRPYRSIWRGS